MRYDYIANCSLDTSKSFVLEKASNTSINASLLNRSGSQLMEHSMMSDLRIPSQSKRLKEITARQIIDNFRRLATAKDAASGKRNSAQSPSELGSLSST